MSRTAVRATQIAMGLSAVLRDLTTPLKFDPFQKDQPVRHFSRRRLVVFGGRTAPGRAALSPAQERPARPSSGL